MEHLRRSQSRHLLQFVEEFAIPGLASSSTKHSDQWLTVILEELRIAQTKVEQDMTFAAGSTQEELAEIDPYIYYGRFAKYMIEYAKSKRTPEFDHLIQLNRTNDVHQVHRYLNLHHRRFIEIWQNCSILNQEACMVPIERADIYNYFASPDVHYEIESQLDQVRHLQGTFNGIRYHLEIYYNPRRTRRFPTQRISQLLHRVGIMCHVASRPNSSTLYIRVWMTSPTKQIYWDTVHKPFLGIMNVNSGCTIHSHNPSAFGRILIWRKEECEKVLVHEMIHAFRIDFSTYAQNIDREIKETFCLENDQYINLAESYTETWTVLLSTAMYCLYSGNGTLAEYKELLFQEVAFSALQVAKILVYFRYTCFSDFITPDQSPDSSHLPLFQGSAILAYYVLKSAILWSFPEFLKYCSPAQPSTILEMCQFTDTPKQYWDFVKKMVLKPSYGRIVTKMIKRLTRYQKKGNHFHFRDAWKSLRMTLHDFRQNDTKLSSI